MAKDLIQDYTHITGELNEDVIINGVTYKSGTVITIPVQLGLDLFFKDVKKIVKEDIE